MFVLNCSWHELVYEEWSAWSELIIILRNRSVRVLKLVFLVYTLRGKKICLQLCFLNNEWIVLHDAVNNSYISKQIRRVDVY